jgi:hypothetical protein
MEQATNKYAEEYLKMEISNIILFKATWEYELVKAIDALMGTMRLVDIVALIRTNPRFKEIGLSTRSIEDRVYVYRKLLKLLPVEKIIKFRLNNWRYLMPYINATSVLDIWRELEIENGDGRVVVNKLKLNIQKKEKK